MTLFLRATALLLAVAATPFAAASDDQAGKRTLFGTLILDGVPELPADLGQRIREYQQARSATLDGWTPNGEILIRTRFGETAQVHRVERPLGSRRQITFFEEPVREVAVNPRDNGFALLRDTGGNEIYQLYWFNTDNQRVRRMSNGRGRLSNPLWSADGEWIAYGSTERNGRDTDIWIQPIDGEPQMLVDAGGMWLPLSWSPDGRRLLIRRYVSIVESQPYIVDVETGVMTAFREEEWPAAFTEARFSRDGRGIYYLSDAGTEFRQLRYHDLSGNQHRTLTEDVNWDVTEFALTDDGRWLAYVLNVEGRSQVHFEPLHPRVRRVAPPELPTGVISRLAFEPGRQRLAIAMSGPRTAGDVFVVEPGDTRPQRWTTSEIGALDAETFSEPELVRFESFDGLSVPAFYHRPEGEGPHPVLIQIHGGPESQARPSFSPLTEFYRRELGVALLIPNVRGSTGYGRTYVNLDNGFLREDSVRDIGALLDWIEQQPELDSNRVAVMGGSYGGYMVLASLVHYSDRLRAGVNVVGISNFVTFLENTGDYRRNLRRREYGDERDPEMREFLERISPLNNARYITSPLMIAQGANDPRVPRSEAEQMVATIREHDGKVWYWLALDEGHGFSRKTNRDHYQSTAALFLQTFLLPEYEPPAPIGPPRVVPDPEAELRPEPEPPPARTLEQMAPESSDAPPRSPDEVDQIDIVPEIDMPGDIEPAAERPREDSTASREGGPVVAPAPERTAVPQELPVPPAGEQGAPTASAEVAAEPEIEELDASAQPADSAS
jgi:dipeptidyl aminopeptidase/acylaminoacyl peptidase